MTWADQNHRLLRRRLGPLPGRSDRLIRADGRAAVWAGVTAGVGSALAQVLLWLAFTDAFPRALFRDARLTAAILLGQGVLLSPTTFDVRATRTGLSSAT